MSYDSREIANFFLDCADLSSRQITILTLLKTLYFSQGWYLAGRGVPLIAEEFEAWQLGPVIRSVWECFKDQGSRPILTRAMRFDPISGSRSIAKYALDWETENFLRRIFDIYAAIPPFQLSEMTHEKGSPWDQIWNAPSGKITLGMKIPTEMIRKYFQEYPSRVHIN